MGFDVDPDGYVVGVDAEDAGARSSTTIRKPVGTNAMTTFSALAEGEHELELTGLAPNCAVDGVNPQTVTVIAEMVASAVFHVECVLTGSIEVAIHTTGASLDLDPDGYAVTIDAGQRRLIGINETTTFTGLTAGEYELELTDLASNCGAEGANPRTVPVSGGETAQVSFAVECVFVLREIAFVRGGDLWIMGTDSSSPVPLTSDGGVSPAWSPDGKKIAFSSRRDGNFEVYVVDADGSDPMRLTNDGAFDGYPAWSPDGSKIAFERDGDIWIMNADGGSSVPLMNDGAFDGSPSWSPDGSKIAFDSTRDGNFEVYVMNADGSNLVRLTNDGAFDGSPAWSPDGTKIAFQHGDPFFDIFNDGAIWVMDADGANSMNLINGFSPAWSPDGMEIAFDRDDGIWVMDAVGSNPKNLTPADGGGEPAWSSRSGP
jgi:hypothetical protein